MARRAAVHRVGAPGRARALRPRLVVVAPDAAETARFAGGWLVDRVLAGWEATVLCVEEGDPLPLRILGARAAPLGPVPLAAVLRTRPHAVAVHAGLYAVDPWLRRLTDAAASGGTEVILWGSPRLVAPGSCGAIPHLPSRAARLFKARALAATAHPPPPTDPIELFRPTGPLPYP
ncbi:hypothetical protein [Actinocorallia sp. A-T 12471]|uniref:hypothetical protein n=1 Tax=Actinocorallia sp. A-T 12471 TaxID=3089813 RepID=UPI0029D2F32D|nr:hypothetical protein [Actinocorallia sp. A-T 12471]MDX6740832.1 hypothetical protein [Actinocorallia sp. A-T 12471]